MRSRVRKHRVLSVRESGQPGGRVCFCFSFFFPFFCAAWKLKFLVFRTRIFRAQTMPEKFQSANSKSGTLGKGSQARLVLAGGSCDPITASHCFVGLLKPPIKMRRSILNPRPTPTALPRSVRRPLLTLSRHRLSPLPAADQSTTLLPTPHHHRQASDLLTG